MKTLVFLSLFSLSCLANASEIVIQPGATILVSPNAETSVSCEGKKTKSNRCTIKRTTYFPGNEVDGAKEIYTLLNQNKTVIRQMKEGDGYTFDDAKNLLAELITLGICD